MYKNGEKDGEYKIYNKNGQVVEIGNYKNGKIRLKKEYYGNKNIKRVTNYNSNGKKDGEYKYYKTNGAYGVTIYKNGIIISKIDYFSSSHRKYVYSYNKNGKVDGITKGYFDSEKGELESIWTYKNGKLDGKFERYYKDGSLKQEGAYVNGRKEIYADY